jgi:hypothetical protein
MEGRRARRTDQFFITIGSLDYYADIRCDFLSYFNNIETYCVSVEKNNINKKCHVHAYLKFYDLLSVCEVRELLC